ncbi:MAG: CocE/NonD family hydrolase [Sphingomonas sp.]
MIRPLLAACAPLALAAFATAPAALAQKGVDERPAKLAPRDANYEYTRKVVDIRMRDGVKLHTVIVMRKGTKDAGILLTRTPYDAEGQTKPDTGSFAGVLSHGDGPWDVIAADGYIRVIQDVRGMHGSEGITLMNPTPAGSPNNPTKTDDATDTYDTIAWLVKNVPETNGRVGISGISYDGFLPLMALINPHPALKVSVPMNPMVDGWRGDDWFHNGAFRQVGLSYLLSQQGTRDAGTPWITDTADDYEYWLKNVSAGAVAKKQGVDQASGFYRKMAAHPAYDSFWQGAAMDRILAREPLKVPTMLVGGLWDQEDIYGAPAVYRALEPKDTANDTVFLTLGPWYHGQEIRDGSSLGAIKWDSDTAKWWRWQVLRPFLAHYLKSAQPAMDVAPVTAFQSGTNQWQRLQAWTQPTPTPLYLKPGGSLGFAAAGGAAQTADYLSDPANPVSYRVRPTKPTDAAGSTWRYWLVDDQRPLSGRPDVLTFTSDVLTAPVTIAGTPQVHLTASTSGTDSDWVVKLIDVYPDVMPRQEEMAGYQLGIAMDIFRGRYREDLAVAKPLTPNAPLKYTFALPETNHVFLPGHRIMVQVQSSWFPLYDRNPQTFVPNIFNAQAKDYVKATQKVTVAGPDASYIDLPVVR